MTATWSAVLAALWSQLGGDADDLGAVASPRHPVPLPARTDVGGLAWASVAAASLAAARAGGSAAVALDPDRIAVGYSSERHFRLDGAPLQAFAALSAFFRTADGWVRTHGNYPHHAAALRRALALPEYAEKDAAVAAFAQRRSAELAASITAAGGLCVVVAREDRSADAARRAAPLIRVERLGEAPPSRALEGHRAAPLRGIRVLDLTRVIAGPIGTRTLALLGADVLRIDPPAMPEIGWQHLETGHGKRSAQLDLAEPASRRRFDELLATADVVALGYRPAALDRLGLSPAALAAKHPGLIVVRHSAWGDPSRRGFDSIVQASSGISWVESPDGSAPGALPAQALDHSAGYVLAAAAITLLDRRSREGGSWLAETSLRRIASELLGTTRRAEPAADQALGDARTHLQTFEVDGASVTTVAPVIAYDGGPTAFAPPRVWGQDEPAWLDR